MISTGIQHKFTIQRYTVYSRVNENGVVFYLTSIKQWLDEQGYPEAGVLITQTIENVQSILGTPSEYPTWVDVDGQSAYKREQVMYDKANTLLEELFAHLDIIIQTILERE